jgi:hypothetical protein
MQGDEHGADLRLRQRGNAARWPSGAVEQQRLQAADLDVCQSGTPRRSLQPHGLAGHIELNRQRIAHGEKRQSIAAGADHALCVAHDFIRVLAQCDFFAQRQL